EVGQKIQGEVRKAAEQNQREFFLREPMKAIQKELGQREGQEQIGDELRRKVEEAGMPDDVKERALREVERLETLPGASPEVAVIRNYVDWLVAMPWSKRTEESLDLAEAIRILDEDHYGLDKVKDRIVEFLAVRKMMAERQASSPLALGEGQGEGASSDGS